MEIAALGGHVGLVRLGAAGQLAEPVVRVLLQHADHSLELLSQDGDDSDVRARPLLTMPAPPDGVAHATDRAAAYIDHTVVPSACADVDGVVVRVPFHHSLAPSVVVFVWVPTAS